MARRRSRGVLSCSLRFTLLFFSLHYSSASAAVVDFSFYPQAAQSCLLSASSSSNCDTSTVPKYNACVCSNGGGFIDSAATCIGKSDASDLTTVYTVLSRNCADSNTPVNYPLSQFLAKGGQGTTATTSAKTTTVTGITTVSVSGTTKTSTLLSTVVTSGAAPVVSTISYEATNSAGQPTTIATTLTLAGAGASASSSQSASASGGGGSKGLSTGAIAGIAVGVGVPVVLALVGIIAVLIWKTKKDHKKRESETHVGSPPGPSSARPVSSVTTLPVESNYPQPPLYGGGQQYKPPQASYSPEQQYAQPPYGHPNYNYPQYAGGYSPSHQHQGMAPGVVEAGGSPVVSRPHELPGYQ